MTNIYFCRSFFLTIHWWFYIHGVFVKSGGEGVLGSIWVYLQGLLFRHPCSFIVVILFRLVGKSLTTSDTRMKHQITKLAPPSNYCVGLSIHAAV